MLYIYVCIYCWFTSDESVCEFGALVNDEQRDKSNVECDDGASKRMRWKWKALRSGWGLLQMKFFKMITAYFLFWLINRCK